MFFQWKWNAADTDSFGVTYKLLQCSSYQNVDENKTKEIWIKQEDRFWNGHMVSYRFICIQNTILLIDQNMFINQIFRLMNVRYYAQMVGSYVKQALMS